MNPKPLRLQRKRIKGWKLVSPNGLPCVYVGRPSKWRNPYVMRKLFDNKCPMTREQAVAFYKNRLKNYGVQLGWFSIMQDELKNRNLVCWCPLCEVHKNGKPWDIECSECAPCHADPLLVIVNNVCSVR